MFRREVETMKHMNHKHIVKLLSSNDSTFYKDDGVSERPIAFIAQEAVLGGELEEYVEIGGAFDEHTCRHYFT